jgi:hypothetical protein
LEEEEWGLALELEGEEWGLAPELGGEEWGLALELALELEGEPGHLGTLQQKKTHQDSLCNRLQEQAYR